MLNQSSPVSYSSGFSPVSTATSFSSSSGAALCDRHLLGLAPWLPYLPRKTIAPQIEIRRNDLFFVSEKPTYETNTLLGFLSTNHAIFGASAN